MSAVATELGRRFAAVEQAARGGLVREGGLVVATSGRLDWMVLLHLLRCGFQSSGLPIHVAHFDRRMREESRSDSE